MKLLSAIVFDYKFRKFVVCHQHFYSLECAMRLCNRIQLVNKKNVNEIIAKIFKEFLSQNGCVKGTYNIKIYVQLNQIDNVQLNLVNCIHCIVDIHRSLSIWKQNRSSWHVLKNLLLVKEILKWNIFIVSGSSLLAIYFKK